jgi:hypothetical protein
LVYDAGVVVLAYMAVVFKLWMIFDATRRRVHGLWYLALILPLGDLVYFFAVKLRDFNARSSVAPGAPVPPPALAAEREAEQSPSFRNRVRAGWALLDAGLPERGRSYFEQALGTHASDKEARFGLGLCLLEQGQAAAAVETLTSLVERSLPYQDYDAALALAEALFRADCAPGALELLQSVIRESRRLEHRLLLARYQLRADERAAALTTLRGALSTFESQAEPERRRDGAVATEARRLLRTLEQQAG